jgi:hypothetical protein
MWLPLQDNFDRLRHRHVVCPYHPMLLLPTFEVVNLLLRMTHITSEVNAGLYLQSWAQSDVSSTFSVSRRLIFVYAPI